VIESLEPKRLADLLAHGAPLQLVDVREVEELDLAPFPGVVHIPLGDLAGRVQELDPNLPTVCICHHGVRSGGAAQLLARHGFPVIYNLSGGVDRWALEVDRAMRRY
jgi:rhodanese-related sulfurtransferase